MPITVNYQPQAGALGALALMAGHGQYLDHQRQLALAEAAQRGDQAARQQQLALQGQQQQLDAQRNQQQFGLQARQQMLDAYSKQAGLGLQAQSQAAGDQARQEQMALDAWGKQAGLAQQQEHEQFQAAVGQQGAQDAFARQQAAADQQQQREQDMFEWKYTANQEHQMGELNQALDWIDQQQGSSQITPDQATNMKWEVQQQLAGMKPRQMPKQRPPNVQDELQNRMTQDDAGNTYILQPDGKIDYRPPPKPEPAAKPDVKPMTERERTTERQLGRKELTKTVPNDDGVGTRQAPPTEEELADWVDRREAERQARQAGGARPPVPQADPLKGAKIMLPDPNKRPEEQTYSDYDSLPKEQQDQIRALMQNPAAFQDAVRRGLIQPPKGFQMPGGQAPDSTGPAGPTAAAAPPPSAGGPAQAPAPTGGPLPGPGAPPAAPPGGPPAGGPAPQPAAMPPEIQQAVAQVAQKYGRDAGQRVATQVQTIANAARLPEADFEKFADDLTEVDIRRMPPAAIQALRAEVLRRKRAAAQAQQPPQAPAAPQFAPFSI